MDTKICSECKNELPLTMYDKIIDEVYQKQQKMVSEFLNINPLPTLPGDRVEGTV